MFGIGGAVTLPGMDGLREAVKKIPLERLLLETDAPYVKPIWELDNSTGFHKGPEHRHDTSEKVFEKWNKYNTSRNIPEYARVIAEIKGISLEKVCIQTYENALQLFHLSEHNQ